MITDLGHPAFAGMTREEAGASPIVLGTRELEFRVDSLA
jgi:hypothetical protein